LVHPSVVRVYDLATADNDELYIVMEFLEGKDLSEAIETSEGKRQRLPIWFAIQIARETLRALHYVTTEATDKNGRILGLIHRDISPHNIFVCYDGQVKLTDFGVAKVQESNVKTQVGITKGKLGYMSPEQLMGSPLDFRSDLYNVGILLFESITGRQLFAGASTAEFLQAMVRGIVPPIPSSLQVPPELEALIRRTLDRDRNRRPASAIEFERELGQIAERYGLTAQPAHVAHHLRELYGQTPAAPQLVKPMTAPQKLKSMMLAAVDAPMAAALAAPNRGSAAANAANAAVAQNVQRQGTRPITSSKPAAPAPSSSSSSSPGGYQSPYARPQTISAPVATPVVDDDFATLVRPIETLPAPRVEARVPPVQRPPSRPASPLPAEPLHQPRVQVAVSARMRALPGDDLPTATAAAASSQSSASSPSSQSGSGAFALSHTSELTNPLAKVPSLQSQSQSHSQRRPATVARGNARPLEALPSMPRPSSAPTPSSSPSSSKPAGPAKKPLPSSPQAAGAAPAWDADDLSFEGSDKTRVEAIPAIPSRPLPAPLPPPPSTNSTANSTANAAANSTANATANSAANSAASSTPNSGPTPAARGPTVQIGGNGVGVRSKRVVPLDDPKP
ncbi:MAG TPA: serine/threonine-protein kinase, partial [Myxococcota bacterium]